MDINIPETQNQTIRCHNIGKDVVNAIIDINKPYTTWETYLLMQEHLATFQSGASSSPKE